jgi:membrane-associated phospholipid phosphatase
MRAKTWIWVAFFSGIVLLLWATKHWPYFPGDVTITHLTQAVTPEDTSWARSVSSTAKSPWILLLTAFAVAVSWRVAGWRAALAALASLAGMWLVGLCLGPLIARPRPSPDLVRVAEKLAGYSFPSVFALNYASTIGFLAVLLYRKTAGALRAGGLSACFVMLLIGWTARIALGAHWPSDVTLSYFIGILWAAFLIRFV